MLIYLLTLFRLGIFFPFFNNIKTNSNNNLWTGLTCHGVFYCFFICSLFISPKHLQLMCKFTAKVRMGIFFFFKKMEKIWCGIANGTAYNEPGNVLPWFFPISSKSIRSPKLIMPVDSINFLVINICSAWLHCILLRPTFLFTFIWRRGSLRVLQQLHFLSIEHMILIFKPLSSTGHPIRFILIVLQVYIFWTSRSSASFTPVK